MSAWVSGNEVLRAQQLVRKVVRFTAGHSTHSWDARATCRGHFSLSRIHSLTPTASMLIKIIPQLWNMLCKLFSEDNHVRKELGVRLKKWGGSRSAYHLFQFDNWGICNVSFCLDYFLTKKWLVANCDEKTLPKSCWCWIAIIGIINEWLDQKLYSRNYSASSQKSH